MIEIAIETAIEIEIAIEIAIAKTRKCRKCSTLFPAR